MDFKITGRITDVETIAIGTAIRERARLRKVHGKGRWRKLKGIASVCFTDGTICKAEIHWYEAYGIPAPRIQIKRLLCE